MNELDKKMSFKMGVKFADPFYIRETFIDILYNIRDEEKPNRF